VIVAWHEVAWDSATPKRPSRRVRRNGISQVQERALTMRTPLGLPAPDHTVPYGTVLSRGVSQALRSRRRSHRPSGTGESAQGFKDALNGRQTERPNKRKEDPVIQW
jgi:hypothetical protein